jgi:hypothetical protein
MILYYAVGGGLGHLARGLRVIGKLGLTDVAIATASPYAERVCKSYIPVPRSLDGNLDAHRAWIRDLGAERIIADTFPGGIQGELCGLDVPIDYVARLLRWDVYRAAVPFALPEIGTTYVVEELTHAPFGNVVRLDLSVSDVPVVPEEPHWLVVHSGPDDEVRELVACAKELGNPERLMVVSGAAVWPASALFPAAAKIITAAGFNVMLETEQWRAKHVVIPFARRFDDQFVRAARRKKRLSSASAPGPAAEM